MVPWSGVVSLCHCCADEGVRERGKRLQLRKLQALQVVGERVLVEEAVEQLGAAAGTRLRGCRCGRAAGRIGVGRLRGHRCGRGRGAAHGGGGSPHPQPSGTAGEAGVGGGEDE